MQPLVFAGVVCYSAYIVHALLLKYMDWPKGLDFVTTIAFGGFVFGTFLISAITFAIIEALGIRHLPSWAQRIHFYQKLVQVSERDLLWHEWSSLLIPRKTIDGKRTGSGQTWRKRGADGK